MKELLYFLVDYGYRFVWLIILADVALSWLICVQRPRWMYHPAVLWVQHVAFRILRPFRKIMNSLGLGRLPIDFSPVLAMFAVKIVAGILLGIIDRLPIP